MTLDTRRVREHLKNFELEKLFIEELGWDRHAHRLEIQVNGQSYALCAFARKRGVQIFACGPAGDYKIPDYKTRRRLERELTKRAYEHLIIFVDAGKTTQIWQWVDRQPGKPSACREHIFYPQHQSGDALIQKLNAIMIPLDEEEALDLTGAVHRLRDAFDRDRVTKKFYDHFKREHAAFLDFIQGINGQGDKAWYASLMLNRLMFIYFIEKKGFLDGDRNYLQNRLKAVQQRRGKGTFLTFYRYFLTALFHEGFSRQPSHRSLDAELAALLGSVPYLNGGLFEVHALEEHYPTCDIPDEAFEKLFAFFDQYEWHLDARPLRNDKEINPDVLGYIFEKYINQKEMGAYYTKEDITEYISKNTIIPYLFDGAKKKCAVAFEPDSAVWRLLRDDPDRYLYPAVRKGIIDEQGAVIPLPKEIEKGVKQVSERGGWNRSADPEYALPTETWREHVARRQRCLEVREKLTTGDVHEINDLITYNLNIRQFAEDVIVSCEGPELLRAFYQAISSVTVLDPTCGSGAFLFAALNILEPLYEACLDRMQAFVDDLERSTEKHSPKKFEDLRKVLDDINRHPNQTYFILKSIIVNNLHGVDIMAEAVEICKLRLFLKLVAQVDKDTDLEPLPDIDFNIRAGNTLVGFVNLDQVRRAAESEMVGTRRQKKLISTDTDDSIRRIEEEAEVVEKAYKKFHEMQTTYGMDGRQFNAQKQELRNRLTKLTDELDRYLAGEYTIDPDKPKEYDTWRTSHQPFHWFAEFYGIMSRGGFDVVVGNPPYVTYSSGRVPYSLEYLNYRTLEAKNLYAFIFERSLMLAGQSSPVGLIVQLSVLSSEKMSALQDLLLASGTLYALPFPRRPESMFDGVEMPVAILLCIKKATKLLVTSRVGRFYTQERPTALSTLRLACHSIHPGGSRIAKIGTEIEKEIYEIISGQKSPLGELAVRDSHHLVYYQEACRYWLKAFPRLPYFERNGEKIAPAHGRVIYCESAEAAAFMGCLLNSTLFYWYYSILSDCEHVNDSLVREILIPNGWKRIAWGELSKELAKNLQSHSTRKEIRTKQGHCIKYDEMKAFLSKNIIDKIDSSLANCYGLTKEQSDFLINYDIKYRMGADSVNNDE